jgi:tetratricopeptide (TPR) repeat protein
MLEPKLRQCLTMAAGALVLAAVARPVAAAQGFLRDTQAPREQRLVESIAAEQSRNGTNSEELIGPLTGLGVLYEEVGSHALAIAAWEQARQVVRANYGLSSMEEAPLLEHLIEIEESVGDVAAAWESEQKLVELVQRNPNDLRAAPILDEIGDRRMAILNRYLAGEFPEEIVLGCYYARTPMRTGGPGSCNSGSRQVLIVAIVTDAWRYYSGAVGVFLRNEDYSSTELREIETKLVRVAYDHRAYGSGRESLRRLIAYDVANAEPMPVRVDALVRLADWDVLLTHATRVYTKYDEVLAEYQAAYNSLAREGADPAAIEAIFAPQVPVTLPTFLPNPLVSEKTQSSIGYVDVEFGVNQYGKAERVRILDSTMNAPRSARRDLEHLIERSSYRPRMVDGRVAESAPLRLRYYLNE